MTDESVQALRDAASIAHRRADTDTAVALYQKILDLFPDSAEAVEAAFYLSSIGLSSRRKAPRRVEMARRRETKRKRERVVE